MQDFLFSLTAFLSIVSILVFVHEWGHFYAARICGVKVDVFAIGFGKTIWSKIDRKGTEWKINMLPLGGYVKMFGDAGPASNVDIAQINSMTENQRSISFFYKKLWQKAFIVFAGPFMNYVLAFLVMAFVLFTYGDKTISTEISSIEKNSAAEKAGLLPGDIIIKIQSQKIANIFEMKSILERAEKDVPLSFVVLRKGVEQEISILPMIFKANGKITMRIGISGTEVTLHYTVLESIVNATKKIHALNSLMIDGLIMLLSGNGSSDDIGGPIKIAQISGEAAKNGLQSLLGLLILLSINLGMINLIPIPGLDGGHIMYYLIHAVTGKPVHEKIQNISIQMGFLLLISLIVFVTYNDILNLLK